MFRLRHTEEHEQKSIFPQDKSEAAIFFFLHLPITREIPQYYRNFDGAAFAFASKVGFRHITSFYYFYYDTKAAPCLFRLCHDAQDAYGFLAPDDTDISPYDATSRGIANLPAFLAGFFKMREELQLF